MNRSLSSLLVLLPLALVAASVGCSSTVIGGGDDGSDGTDGEPCGIVGCEDGSDGEDGGPGPDPQPELRALVIERDGLALLQFSSFALSCSEESPALPDCRTNEDWLLEVEMPARYLVPGVVDFSDPEVYMFTQVRGGAEADGQCVSGGGGSGFGSMTIHSVSAGSVSVTVDDAIMTFDTPSRSVDFEVARCTAGEPVGSFALGYTIAGYGGGAPDDNFTTTYQAGGEPQEDRFVVQIADHDAATCDNPYASPACPTASRSVSVSIPMSQFVIGNVIDLTRYDIYVYTSEQGLNEGANDCWFGGGSGPESGTMTLVAAGQGTIDVRFDGTNQDLLSGAHTVEVCD